MPDKCAFCGKFIFPSGSGCKNAQCAGFKPDVNSSALPSSPVRTMPSTSTQPAVGTMGSMLVASHQPLVTLKPPPKLVQDQAPVMPVALASSSKSEAVVPVKAETWRERDARLMREREEARERHAQLTVTLGLRVNEACPPIDIQEGPAMYFRACGKGQEPWDLLDHGFVHRSGRKTTAEIKAYLAQIYGTTHGGAASYMSGYRINADTNPAKAPFISAGKKKGDASGASNSCWQYAVEVRGLREVVVTQELLGSPTPLSPKVGDVKLLTDNPNLDQATTFLLFHGPLPEATWLSHIDKSAIKGWVKLGGHLWEQEWRAFNEAAVRSVCKLAADFNYDMAAKK